LSRPSHSSRFYHPNNIGSGVQIMKLLIDKWVPVTTAWRVLRLQMPERPSIWRVAANILNKQSRIGDKGWSPAWGLGEVLTTPHRKNVSCYKMFTDKTSDLDWVLCTCILTLTLLTWRIWWSPNNAIRWQMGFNSAFKGLNKKLLFKGRYECIV
jgi:hypothetical protein